MNLPDGMMFNIYVENVSHKTTRTMIFFTGPCDLEITRNGERGIVTGMAETEESLV